MSRSSPTATNTRSNGDFYADGKPFDSVEFWSDVRAPTGDVVKPAKDEKPAGSPQLGKYGCAESVYSSDGYHSETRGFITLIKKGKYGQGKGKKRKFTTAKSSGKAKLEEVGHAVDEDEPGTAPPQR